MLSEHFESVLPFEHPVFLVREKTFGGVLHKHILGKKKIIT